MPRTRRQEDYIGLPNGVYPTPIEVLEQNGDLLFIKRYDHGRTYSPKQEQIFKMLVEHGNQPDAPGSVTVACLWGLKGTERAIELFEPHGHTPAMAANHEDVVEFFSGWFRERRKRRSV